MLEPWNEKVVKNTWSVDAKVYSKETWLINKNQMLEFGDETLHRLDTEIIRP